MQPIKGYIEDEIVGNPPYNILLVYVERLSKRDFNVYIRASDINLEKEYYRLKINPYKPKGYVVLNNVLVLLYKDVDYLFEKVGYPEDIISTDEKINLIFSNHKNYQCYFFRKNLEEENILDYIEYKGEISSIPD
ncbi:MAG: hypothetical protein Aureis2KO_01440 [Aureisphaera sp.]